ncbi:MAG TPA: hypothetical protein VF074_20305, partial [Pyrinomonadaceae bacterium]
MTSRLISRMVHFQCSLTVEQNGILAGSRRLIFPNPVRNFFPLLDSRPLEHVQKTLSQTHET